MKWLSQARRGVMDRRVWRCECWGMKLGLSGRAKAEGGVVVPVGIRTSRGRAAVHHAVTLVVSVSIVAAAVVLVIL
jgi:hypothetical protein